jgi:1-acyl-sn-glycerol-3-phosphate acyltransferase
MTCIKSRMFDIAFVLWTALFAPAIPIFWLCGSPEHAVRSATRLWARGVLFGLRFTVGLNYVERGRQPVTIQPHLIISNHQSTWETLAFLLIFPDVAMIAKQELLRIPVFGWYLRHSPMIIINRESGSNALRRMIKESQKASAKGRSVLVFPEGSRICVSKPVRFRRGIELLYAELGLPVLPVAINSGLYWCPFHRYRRHGTITVSHLEPIEPGLLPLDFIRTVEATIEAEARRLTERVTARPDRTEIAS